MGLTRPYSCRMLDNGYLSRHRTTLPGMSLDAADVKPESLESIHLVAVVLALITGVFHLYAGLVEGRAPVTLAGVGFITAVGLFLAGFRRRFLYPIAVVYTGVQIPLWYVAKAGEFTTIGYADKAVQVLLIVVLVAIYRRGD